MKFKRLTLDEIKMLKKGDEIYDNNHRRYLFEELNINSATSEFLVKVQYSNICLNISECFIETNTYNDKKYPIQLRDYIGSLPRIDGREIPYRISTAYEYIFVKGIVKTEVEAEDWVENNNDAYHLLNRIIALKQSCFLLRHTSYSCGSLSEDLYYLRWDLERELLDNYNIEFDDELMEKSIEGNL